MSSKPTNDNEKNTNNQQTSKPVINIKKRQLSNKEESNPTNKKKHKQNTNTMNTPSSTTKNNKNKNKNKNKHKAIIHTPSTPMSATTPSTTKKNRIKKPANNQNQKQIPCVLLPNTYLNYTRYNAKKSVAKRNALRKGLKGGSVAIGLDLRTYTSEIAGVTQIVNMIKGTTIAYPKRKQKQNWSRDISLKQWLFKYIEIYGDESLSELFANGTESKSFVSFKSKLKSKNYDVNVKKFIEKAMTVVVKKMIKKYKLSELIETLRKGYVQFYGDDVDDDDDDDVKNDDDSIDLDIYWSSFVTKQKYDEMKSSYLQAANVILDAQEEMKMIVIILN